MSSRRRDPGVPRDPMQLDAEEYLDRCGVTAYLKDAVTLILDNRPTEPLNFLHDYFRSVTQGSSPLLRAYRYLRLCPLGQPAFADNVVEAYATLDAQRGTPGVTGAETHRLLSLLCSDFPLDVSASVLAAIGKRGGDLVSFDEFSVAVRVCLQYETFFARLDSVIATCDVDGVGQVHTPLAELAQRSVAPPPAPAPPQPPKPDMLRLEREAQLAFAGLRQPGGSSGGGGGGSPGAGHAPLAGVAPADFVLEAFRASLGPHAEAAEAVKKAAAPGSPRREKP